MVTSLTCWILAPGIFMQKFLPRNWAAARSPSPLVEVVAELQCQDPNTNCQHHWPVEASVAHLPKAWQDPNAQSFQRAKPPFFLEKSKKKQQIPNVPKCQSAFFGMEAYYKSRKSDLFNHFQDFQLQGEKKHWTDLWKHLTPHLFPTSIIGRNRNTSALSPRLNSAKGDDVRRWGKSCKAKW